jgi:hypothetical protein
MEKDKVKVDEILVNIYSNENVIYKIHLFHFYTVLIICVF